MKTTRKNGILILLAIVMLGVWGLYTSCGQPNKFSSTIYNTTNTGNPLTQSATEILYAVCSTVSRCDGVSIDTCLSGVKATSGVSTQLGLSSGTYSTYSSIVNAEQTGLITGNPVATNSCVTSINNLTCSSALVQGAYNTSATDPFSGVAYMIPTDTNSSCVTVFAEPPGVKDYYVSATTGADSASNDGSQAKPWATINYADGQIQLGSAGTVVHVLPGTYTGPITTAYGGTSNAARVRWISETPQAALVTNSNWTVKAPFVDVVGFDMTAPGPGSRGIMCLVSAGAHDCHIMGNYIHDIDVNQCDVISAVETLGSGSPLNNNNWVIGNIVRHVGADAGAPNHCNQGEGINVNGEGDIVFNNVVSGAIGWGIHVYGDVCCQTIANNTVFNNSQGGIVLSVSGPTHTTYDNSTIINNIIVNNGVGGQPNYGIDEYSAVGASTLISNNLLYGNLPSNFGRAGICPDPCNSVNTQTGTNATVFVNYQGDTNTAPAANFNVANYALKAGGPAVDKGTTTCASGSPAPCMPAYDFLNFTRPYGSAPDIGAFEWHP